jgi:hypothetical protein
LDSDYTQEQGAAREREKRAQTAQKLSLPYAIITISLIITNERFAIIKLNAKL